MSKFHTSAELPPGLEGVVAVSGGDDHLLGLVVGSRASLVSSHQLEGLGSADGLVGNHTTDLKIFLY